MAELFRDDQVTIAATNQQTEPWRINRLHRVVGYVCALAEQGRDDVLSRLVSLQDNKGALDVTWRRSPSEADKQAIVRAWSSRIGDGAANVEHHVKPEASAGGAELRDPRP